MILCRYAPPMTRKEPYSTYTSNYLYISVPSLETVDVQTYSMAPGQTRRPNVPKIMIRAIVLHTAWSK